MKGYWTKHSSYEVEIVRRQKQNKYTHTCIHCLQDTHFQYEYRQVTSEQMKNIYFAESKQKAGMAINITRQISKPNALPEIKEDSS